MNIDERNLIWEDMWEYGDSNFNEDRLWNGLMEEDFSEILWMVRKPYLLTAYKRWFDFIPDDQKYDTFVNSYIRTEYEFGRLTCKITDRIRKLKPQEVNTFLNSIADSKGLITVYRGESTESTAVEKALSWTLNRDTAEWFAKRFNFSKQGYVYAAQVKVKDVICFTDERNEQEVIVRYKHLLNVTTAILPMSNGQDTELAGDPIIDMAS